MPTKISYNQYRGYAAKGTPQVYFDKFYRWVSHPITFLGMRFGATPNFFTACSFLCTVVGGGLVIRGFAEYGLLVMVFGYVFDFCDGNAARVIIKTSGLSKTYQLRGSLLESVNTNVYITVLYGALGWYFFTQIGSPEMLAFAFGVAALKIISRYTVRHAYELFRNTMQLVQPGDEMMRKYAMSFSARIKFFITKSFFSPNFSLVIMLFAVLVLPEYVVWVFAAYAGADAFVSVARASRAVFKRYEE